MNQLHLHMEKIVVAKAMPSDLANLLELAKITFYEAFGPSNTEENIRLYMEESFTEEGWRQQLANPDSVFFLARTDDELIGYIKLNVGGAQTEQHDEKAMELERIYVAKEWQSRRVGQLLMDKAIAMAKERGASCLWLGVFEANIKAVAFYRRNGFEVFDEHLFLLGTDEQRDLMMKRGL